MPSESTSTAKDDDLCTLKATDDADVLNLTYEAKIIIATSLVVLAF
jgi:hypothetical protein